MAARVGTSVEADQQSYITEQIREEEITETKQEALRCERCLRGRPSVREHLAVFLCFKCEMYVCVNCLSGHQSHEGMKVGRKGSDREKSETGEMEEQTSSEGMKKKGKGLGKEAKRMRLEEEKKREEEGEKRESERMDEENERKLSDLLDDLMKESKTERIEKLKNSHVSIYDRVYLKHGLDQKDCGIFGLCVLEDQRWVVCDYNNYCIKIFTLGSNVLQRYIRFVGVLPMPRDVTEILENQKSTEPNLVSGSSSEVSVTERADPDKQCLIAVTLHFESQIIFIDLSKKPAKTHKTIRTKRKCYSIQFYDDKIFTTCQEGNGFRWSVYIISTGGVTIKKFYTGICIPKLAVVSGRVYLTDSVKNKVKCRKVKGQFISEITIEGSRSTGVSVDPDNNVYVCAGGHNKVYKLDPDLTRYKSVLDQTADYIEGPDVLCYYRDKLFISHSVTSSLRNYVTLVRLL